MRDCSLSDDSDGVPAVLSRLRVLAIPPLACDCFPGDGPPTNAAQGEVARYGGDRYVKFCPTPGNMACLASALLALSRKLVMHHLASVIVYSRHRRTYTDPSLHYGV